MISPIFNLEKNTIPCNALISENCLNWGLFELHMILTSVFVQPK
jgi:hypothetical protein